MDNTQNSPSTMGSNFTASQSGNNQNFGDTSKERGMINNFNNTRTSIPKKPVNDLYRIFRFYFHIHIEYG